MTLAHAGENDQIIRCDHNMRYFYYKMILSDVNSLKASKLNYSKKLYLFFFTYNIITTDMHISTSLLRLAETM